MASTITVQELKAKVDRGEKIVLIDVREPWEYNICKIPGAQLIPLGTLGTEYKKLDPNADVTLVPYPPPRPLAEQIAELLGMQARATAAERPLAAWLRPVERWLEIAAQREILAVLPFSIEIR